MGLKTVLAAVIFWPIPVFNGLIVAIMSSSEDSIYMSLRSAVASSVVASTFYYLLFNNAYKVVSFFFPNIWFLLLISLSGTAIAAYMSIMTKAKSKRVIMTENDVEAEFYVKSYREVEEELERLGFSCRPEKYVVIDENRGGVEYSCGPWDIQVSITKELNYYHVSLSANPRR